MDTPIMDDRRGRDKYTRRVDLAKRMLAHGARTKTTSGFCVLTPSQLVTWRRRWLIPPEDRLRGPSPTSYHPFFCSLWNRGQATLFVCICRIVSVAPACGSAAALAALFTERNGERLCTAVEIYRAWEPETPFTFEHMALLLMGVVEGERVELGECARCDRAWLIDLFPPTRNDCPRCQRGKRGRPRKEIDEEVAS